MSPWSSPSVACVPEFADLIDVVALVDDFLCRIHVLHSGFVHRTDQTVEVQESDMVYEAQGLDDLVVLGVQSLRVSCLHACTIVLI